jgi:hypothetical protein
LSDVLSGDVLSGDAISGISNPGDTVSIFDTLTTREDEALFLAIDDANSDVPISGDAVSDEAEAPPKVKCCVLSKVPF